LLHASCTPHSRSVCVDDLMCNLFWVMPWLL
jgi:hypothetical protein